MGRAPTTRHQTPNEAVKGSALASLCRPLLEVSPVPMAAVAGPQHVVCVENAPFCRLIGAASETVIGRPFAAVVPAWATSQAVLDQVARTGQAETVVDQPLGDASGGVWSCAVWPLRASGERPVRVLIIQAPETPDADQFRRQLQAMNQALVVSSVRQQERTEAAEALTAGHKAVLEAILEQAPAEIVVRDAQGRLLWANTEVRRWLRPVPGGPEALEGTGLDEIPRLWGDLLDADGQPLPLDAYPCARALRGEHVSPLECQRVAPDGRRRALLNSATPLHDPRGTLVGAVAISTDITLQKQREAELRQARDTLEQRVAARTAELSEAVQSLEVKSTQLRAMASELTLTEQRERQRLAHLLHDGLQQLLAAAKFRVDLLRRVDDSTERDAFQTELQGILDQCIAVSRTLTGELSPPILQSGGHDAPNAKGNFAFDRTLRYR